MKNIPILKLNKWAKMQLIKELVLYINISIWREVVPFGKIVAKEELGNRSYKTKIEDIVFERRGRKREFLY